MTALHPPPMSPLRLSSLLVLVSLSACAGGSQHVEHAEPTRTPIVDTRTFEPIALEALAPELSRVSVVYFGERHDVAADHVFEHDLVAAVLERGTPIAIGLEMFQRPSQAALDDYVAGRIDEATMLERTDFEIRWGHDYAGYRPVLELARAHHVPLVALNARTELSQAIARSGLDSLTPELRAELPELDLGNAAHRAFVDEALRGHPGLSENAIARYYAAQVVWDETMGEGVATYVARAPERTLIVLAGAMHVARGLGIPRTAARRGVASYRIVVATDPESAAEERLHAADGTPSGDYLFVAPAE